MHISTGVISRFGPIPHDRCKRIIALVLALAVPWLMAAAFAADGDSGTARSRLSSHVLPALANASMQSSGADVKSAGSAPEGEPFLLTLVLNRDDEAGFQAYLRDVYDAQSPQFRQFISADELRDRFGPSEANYQLVLDYLQSQGLQLTQGSSNRMTLSVRGTRAQVEQAFDVSIRDYKIGEKSFRANDADPALPDAVAAHVQAISGLSNLATPQPSLQAIRRALCTAVAAVNVYFGNVKLTGTTLAQQQAEFRAKVEACIQHVGDTHAQQTYFFTDPPPPAWQGADGSGQTVGLLEFDTFHLSDIAAYISLIGLPASKIADVSQVHVDGGAGSTPGAGVDEVLLDIDAILAIAPGAKIAVYDGAFAGANSSFQAMFNAMVDGGVDIISNSWAYCEDQTSLADVQSIDSILQTAAATGISVFNGSGDSGSTCLDGAANTIAVPSDAPHATAVGGTTLTLSPGDIWKSETWWDGSADTPQTGQSGFGVSRFFTRPAYQNGHTAAAMRSVPDVVANADPATGVQICNADEGGCPTGTLNGGTSYAAPEWAAFTALLNQTQGTPLGLLNPQIYALAGPGAFHDPAALASDFAHVGLGSPKLALLHQQLTQQTTGPVDPNLSQVRVYDEENFSFPPSFSLAMPAFSDGTTPSYVVVRLVDANANIEIGKTVTLTANAGSHAVIIPASAVTTSDNGAAVFQVTDAVIEPLTFTARDTTDGITLAESARLNGIAPVAASGNVIAFTDAVAADGHSTDTITVTLQDALGRPTPGKVVALRQTGNSVVTPVASDVTDANGQIAFTVTDTVQEIITYTAVDVGDGDLPVPGAAVVTFNASGGDNCGITNLGNPDVGAGPGYAITPFATGFVPLVTSFGGLLPGCNGAAGLAFDALGNLYVSDMHTGNLYKFGPAGGVADASTLISTTPLGPLLQSLTFGHDGKLYGARLATTGNFFTGAVIEINPANGALVRTVAESITCAGFLATDPASGDVFVDDSCGGGGSDNGSIWRISNPGSANPQTSVYAATPGTNGGMSFASGGTLYVIDYAENAIAQISGTASATPGQKTLLSGISGSALGIVATGDGAGGNASTLTLAAAPAADGLPIGIRSFDIEANPALATSLLITNGYAVTQVIGPDQCQYVSMSVAVFKITNADGTCPLRSGQPLLALSPASVSPAPTQGGSQTFSASFHNIDAPAGTTVLFQVSGANAQVQQAATDANGNASFVEVGENAGSDTITASATVNGTLLTSTPAHVIWQSGPHTSFLTLNRSPTSAMAARPVLLSANLTDVSIEPDAPLANATIQFSVDGQSCSASTDSSGTASCAVSIPDVGAFTLTATYAGSAGALPASASTLFSTTPFSDRIFTDGFDGTP
jgi:kumamolisin